jgi:hypothetical protein
MILKILMTIFIFFFKLNWGHTQSEISEKDCPTYDFSDRYPPIRDQNGHNICWAFSSAALFEEQLCLESRKPGYLGAYKCGEKLSVLDILRCNFKLGLKGNEISSSEKTLKCILGLNDENEESKKKNIQQGMGICLEEFAPYSHFRDGLAGYSDKVLRKITDVYSFNSYLMELNSSCSSSIGAGQVEEKMKDSIAILRKLLPKQENMGVNFEKILIEKNNDQEYLRKILVTPLCEKNRIQPIERLSVQVHQIDQLPILGKINLYQESLHKGRSVLGTICINEFISNKNEQPLDMSKCEYHAVVFGGLKWNPAKKQCEVFIRNSWGQGAILNGWVKASAVLQNTTKFSQLSSEQ